MTYPPNHRFTPEPASKTGQCHDCGLQADHPAHQEDQPMRQPTPVELELCRLSGTSVLDQRAMGEQEWTRWYDAIRAKYPRRFNANGDLRITFV